MFKKIIYVMLFCLLLVGCNAGASGTKSKISLESYVEAFEKEGIKVDTEKPMFSLIGAKDGIIFDYDKKVAIYEFDSEKSIKTAEESLSMMKEWERNGLFVLETNDEKSKEIFKSVK
ncbi:hypothetical protein ACFVR1_09285 [Psychrobacillus sp. NPDC058041]|uniref:hypothetical protein n=1 Tax=Psychrobacillus sp. NPDC058041 TaxID=3346310 RepID=UPI0036DEDB20